MNDTTHSLRQLQPAEDPTRLFSDDFILLKALRAPCAPLSTISER
jgi:hypothetical protein